MSSLVGEPMPDPQAKDFNGQLDLQSQSKEHDRRTQVRSETTLSRIEDATYAILRKHEKKPA
jgi:hypothetical protein